MSRMNLQKNKKWPEVGSTILINPGTKLTRERDFSSFTLAAEEICGFVTAQYISNDWSVERLEVLIEDQIYFIHRIPPMHTGTGIQELETPLFNIRCLNDDGTTTKF